MLHLISPLHDVFVNASILSVIGTILALPLTYTIFNVLRQVFFKDPSKPPEVFHFLPVIGSTIQYGIDPYDFFFKCRAKVCI